MAVGRQRDAHRDRHLQRLPDAGRHAPADQVAAVAHRARLGVALAPAEHLRALLIARPQRLAAERLVLGLVAIGIAAQAQLDRIELQLDGELVHRRLEREQRGGGARRPHVARRRKVELGQPVRVFGIRRLVEHARPARLLAVEVLVLRGDGHRVVRDRIERAAGVGAQRDALDHGRPVAQHVHLLARQHEPHRAPQRARRQRRQHHLELRAQARAEAAAHEGRHDAHLLRLHAEHAAQVLLHVLHALRLVVHRELAAALVDHRRGIQLHRVVMLDRHEVLGLMAHRGCSQRLVRLPARFRHAPFPAPST